MMYTCTRRMMFILADFEKEFFIMRASGILLPVSSLPSKYGIGCFSKSAFEWIDFLQESGQTFWQILPLGRPVTEILRISHFLLLREIRISFLWKN